MIRGMIFDFDGTLFDSMFVWKTAGDVYLRSMGKEPEENLQAVLKTMSLRQSAEYLKERYGLPVSEEEIINGVNRTVENFYLNIVEPKDGVREWLALLQQRNIKMCIATAVARYQAEEALRRCEIRAYFSEIFSCTEIGAGKDRPDIYRAALRHLGTDRSSTLVVEDAHHALQTAKADGFMTVAVYDASESRQEEIRELADVYLTDCFSLEPFWNFISGK